MDVFTTVAKLWPSGDSLDLGTDYNSVTVPSSFNRHAADFVTSTDGTTNYQFLFWNTGRHLTGKRNVLWNFSVGGWGLWTATRWYGTPSGLPGTPQVRADAFTIGGNAPLTTATPINGTLSTFAPASAWPFGGDDHVIGTAGGAANVVAKDPFDNYQFAGWLQLIFGGDDSGEFIETDAGPLPTQNNFFDHVTAGAFPVAKGASAMLLATYGNLIRNIPNFGRLLQELLQNGIQFNPLVDPAPEDLLRLKVLQQLLALTQPGVVEGNVEFEGLIKAAPSMTREQLQRAVQSVKTTLGLGKSALAALDAQLKNK